MVRIELTADDSLAAMRARSKFGIAIEAMIRMIATTISNSINEKPFCFAISFPFAFPGSVLFFNRLQKVSASISHVRDASLSTSQTSIDAFPGRHIARMPMLGQRATICTWWLRSMSMSSIGIFGYDPPAAREHLDAATRGIYGIETIYRTCRSTFHPRLLEQFLPTSSMMSGL